jgi:hypothetical protein
MRIHRRARLGPPGTAGVVPGDRAGIGIQGSRAHIGVSSAAATSGGTDIASSCARATVIAAAADRCSRRRRSRGLLDRAAQERTCKAQRRPLGPRLTSGEAGTPHATPGPLPTRALTAGQSRAGARLYEWPCPGDLLHVDPARLCTLSTCYR